MNKFLLSLSVAGLLTLSGCNCNPQNCTPGAQACACVDGATCNTGLVCGSDNLCVAPVSAGVQIPDAAARGCEMVLTEAAGTEVVAVTFKNGAKGTWIRQAPKVAVTVVSGGDSALTGAIDLGLTGPAAGLSVSKAGCVDVSGQRLNTSISIR